MAEQLAELNKGDMDLSSVIAMIPKIKKKVQTFTANQWGTVIIGQTSDMQVLHATISGTHNICEIEVYEGSSIQTSMYHPSDSMTITRFNGGGTYSITYTYIDKGLSN